MKRSTLTVLLAVLSAAVSAADYSFVVIGDRTGKANDEVFREVMSEVSLLAPDFVVGVGDLIQGYTSDSVEVEAQWDEVEAMLGAMGVPLYRAPGNHDIWDETSESIYNRRSGGPFFSVQREGALFLFVDNSRWRSFSQLPEEQRRWLRTELKKARGSAKSFVLMHRPFWKYALRDGVADTMHLWFVEAGVDYVFTGHDHFYASHERDSIRYFQVGPSGSRFKVYHDREFGAFQNYLLCRVKDDSVRVSVIEPGSIRQPDIVTWDALSALELAKDSAVEIAMVEVGSGRGGSSRCTLRVRDLIGTGQDGLLVWDLVDTEWSLTPATLRFLVDSGASIVYEIRCRLESADHVYPLPSLSLPYEYTPGRTADLSFRLPVRRFGRLARADSAPNIDGQLDDSCWADANLLTDFGGRTGGANPIERTEVSVCRDSTTIYMAVRCWESGVDALKADVRERDGRVYKDDHLNIVLDPAGDGAGLYYQIFVNSTGTIADRVCQVRDGKVVKDYSWDADWRVAVSEDNASWTVELACPLEDLGGPNHRWGINVVRYQSRFDDIGVWQAPFRHDPRTFGILEP